MLRFSGGRRPLVLRMHAKDCTTDNDVFYIRFSSMMSSLGRSDPDPDHGPSPTALISRGCSEGEGRRVTGLPQVPCKSIAGWTQPLARGVRACTRAIHAQEARFKHETLQVAGTQAQNLSLIHI